MTILFDTGRYTAQVYAVVALLDETHTAQIKSLWSELEVSCGMKAINAAPFPHFSFHIAQSYDLEPLDVHLKRFAAETATFTVRTTGLSIFTGPAPVIYIPLVVDHHLLHIHNLLWDETTIYGEQVSGHYRPGYWVPHITLANKDVTPDGLACIARDYSTRSFVWEAQVNRLAVLSQKGNVGEIFNVYPLQPV